MLPERCLLIWQSTIADAHQLLLPAGRRQSLGVAEEIHGLPGGCSFSSTSDCRDCNCLLYTGANLTRLGLGEVNVSLVNLTLDFNFVFAALSRNSGIWAAPVGSKDLSHVGGSETRR